MCIFRSILCILLLLSLPGKSSDLRWAVYATACSQLGIRELTGRNDGPEIDKYQRQTGVPKGSPYCASGVAWVFAQHNIPNPNSALAANYFRDQSKIVYRSWNKRLTRPIHLMDVFGMWFNSPRGIHHVGFVVKWGNFVETIEANTSDTSTGNGTREGSGWFRKKRLKNQIYIVSTYIHD